MDLCARAPAFFATIGAGRTDARPPSAPVWARFSSDPTGGPASVGKHPDLVSQSRRVLVGASPETASPVRLTSQAGNVGALVGVHLLAPHVSCGGTSICSTARLATPSEKSLETTAVVGSPRPQTARRTATLGPTPPVKLLRGLTRANKTHIHTRPQEQVDARVDNPSRLSSMPSAQELSTFVACSEPPGTRRPGSWSHLAQIPFPIFDHGPRSGKKTRQRRCVRPVSPCFRSVM